MPVVLHHTEKDVSYMQRNSNLQDQLLSRARRGRVAVTVFLVNGFQLRGTITGYDPFVVVVNTEGRQQIIYKHAISTIVPVRPVEWREPVEEESSGA